MRYYLVTVIVCLSCTAIFLLVPAKGAQTGEQIADTWPLDWSSISTDCQQLMSSFRDQTLSLRTTGNDSFFWFDVPPRKRQDRDWIFAFEYFCPEGIPHLQLCVGYPARAESLVDLPELPPAETWVTYQVNLSQLDAGDRLDALLTRAEQSSRVRIDWGDQQDVTIKIRKPQLRVLSDAEVERQKTEAKAREAKQLVAETIRQARAQAWPLTMTNLALVGNQLNIQVKGETSNELLLVPRFRNRMSALAATEEEQKLAKVISTKTAAVVSTNQLTEFSCSLANKTLWQNGVRWQLFKRNDPSSVAIPVSAAFHPSPQLQQDSTILAPKRLRSAKGLTCITPRFSADQLRQLGLEHANVNILLNGLVSESPGRDRIAVTFEDRRWYVDQRRLRQIERDVQTASDAGCVVAGILLIANTSSQRSALAHPDASRKGIYAMPDLTTEEGCSRYAATLHALGEYFGGHKQGRARIDHWIVHNEVDYGWHWTNMGEQPLELFMDHYVRSMRMVDSAVRNFNPHARVFISLTHRWNTTNNLPWKTYAPKSMLQWLVRDCQLSGDFPWGVAYHPYPQSLWKANVWDDTKVSDDFDTELITIKNLPVLDRFMHLPEMRMADGSVRPVLCSEQGFHAAEDNEQQLRTQAAALLYTWSQLRKCPSILAFDYHRPTDHPREGGLRLGLRGLPSSKHPNGKPKPAWKVFQTIGTPDETQLQRQYQSVWQIAE